MKSTFEMRSEKRDPRHEKSCCGRERKNRFTQKFAESSHAGQPCVDADEVRHGPVLRGDEMNELGR